MLKRDLKKYIGQNVIAVFNYNGKRETIKGILGYAYNFSEAYGWRSPNYFYINDFSFKVTHVKELYICEGVSKIRVG